MSSRGKRSRKRIPRIPCFTCGLSPTDTYDDGSPRYDHGHDPVTGETWWAEIDDDDVPVGPAFALHTGLDRFRSREGRDRMRWSFVTWPGEGHPAQEVTAVTGTRGPRWLAWQEAVSESPWCQVRLDEWNGRLGVAEVLPASRLTDARIEAYIDEANAADLDLLAEAVHIFMDMLPEDS